MIKQVLLHSIPAIGYNNIPFIDLRSIMKSAPFSVLPVLYTNLIAGALIGGILGALLGGSGISTVLLGTLCGFIPTAIGGWLRTQIVKLLASSKDIEGPVPYAYPLAIRWAIALVIAFIVSYVAMSVMGLELNFLSGMMIGLTTAITMVIVMFWRMLTK